MSGVPSVTVIDETPTVTVEDVQPDAQVIAPSPFRPTRYSVEDYRMQGQSDDTVIANLLAVLVEDADLAYATNAGGTIVLRAGKTYTLNSSHIIPSHVNVIGESVSDSVVLIAANGAGFVFQDPDAASPQASSSQYGGMSGNLTINANGKTGCPWVVGKCNNRTFLPIKVLDGGGDGIQVYGAQNATFIAPVTTGNAGYGMRFDYGTAGVLVLGGNIYDNTSGNIGFTAQGGYQHSPPQTPETTPQSQVTFIKTIIERPNSLAGTLIDIQAGKRIQFFSCPISAGGATSDLSLVKVRRPNTDLSTTHIQFTDCTLIGRRYTGTSPDTAKVTHFDIDDGANVILDGTTQFTSGYLAYSIGDTASVVANGDVIGLDTVGTYQVASNATIATTVAGDGTHNEVQTLALVGSPNAGTFTITFGGQTTTGLAYNAAAATIQTALQALSSIGSGNVAVTGGPLPATVTLTFQGALALTNVAQITADTSGLLVKNRFDNKGGVKTEDQQIQGHRSHPILFERLNTTDRALILKVASEVFPRMHLRPDLISMGDGTANPDSPFYRGSPAKSLRFDTYIRQGDLDTIRGVSSGTSTASNLPAAPTGNATYRDYAVWVPGDGSTTADELYVCRLMADGTYAWTPVRATPTAVWVAAGAFMNTSGATAGQTTDGRTAIWQLPVTASNIGAEFYLPYWARGWNVDLYWLPKDGTVAASTWEASVRLDKVVPPATPANTLVYGTTNVSTNGLTLGDWQALRVVSAYTPTTAGVFNVRVVRTAGAGQTYNGVVGVVGILCSPVG